MLSHLWLPLSYKLNTSLGWREVLSFQEVQLFVKEGAEGGDRPAASSPLEDPGAERGLWCVPLNGGSPVSSDS